MRVDDDMAWGGCNLHGLYDPDHTRETIVLDFLVRISGGRPGAALRAGQPPTLYCTVLWTATYYYCPSRLQVATWVCGE